MKRSTADAYLIQAKIEELQDEWGAKGYQVADRSALGGIEADLILRRDGETVVFQVTTGSSLAKAAVTSPRLAERVLRLPNTSYRLVVTNPPRERTIEIANLEAVLTSYLAANTPPELTRLLPGVFVKNVERSDVTAVSITRSEIKATGSAAVTVRFNRRPGDCPTSDDDGLAQATLPFEFDTTLDSNLAITKVDRLKVDTSEFDDDEG